MMLEHKNFKKQADNITYDITVAPREITDENVTVSEVGEDGIPEINVSVEAPVGTLEPQETTDYQLSYYDLDHNAVTVEQMIAEPGEYIVVLTFFGNYFGFVEKNIVTNNVTFGEETDNTDRLALWDGREANVTLTRTLQAGSWNTFAAPFSTEIPTGWTVKELIGSSLADGMLTLNFGDAASIEAGKPYLVKVADIVENPTFSGIIVSKDAVTTETAAVDFVPTLGATEITGDPKEVLFLGANNKLLYPEALPDNIMGFRAYFKLKGEATGARSFSLNLGEATGVSQIENGELRMENSVYDLQGRRMETSNLKKGVYIVNGKKVIIK